MKRIFWIIIGYTVLLLLISLMPLLGITGNYSFLIFIVAMFACHLIMPMHHRRNGEHREHSTTTVLLFTMYKANLNLIKL